MPHKPSVAKTEEFFFTHLRLPKISPEQLEILNVLISLSEIMIVIDALKTNKAPGPDGFIVQFYKTFKKILGPRLQKLFFWFM